MVGKGFIDHGTYTHPVGKHKGAAWVGEGPGRTVGAGGRKGGPQAGTLGAKAGVLKGLELFGGSQQMRSDGQETLTTVSLERHAKFRWDQSHLNDTGSNGRDFTGTMGRGLEEDRLRVEAQGMCYRTGS